MSSRGPRGPSSATLTASCAGSHVWHEDTQSLQDIVHCGFEALHISTLGSALSPMVGLEIAERMLYCKEVLP
jgi:hypothetical protein